MCTLVVATRVWPAIPLLVAANRDERLDRQDSPPAIVRSDALSWLAPRDLAEGGTWIGVNERGLFAGITNRFGHARDAGRRTRGELVARALGAPDLHAAAERIGAVDPADYNGFHLVLADRRGGVVLWCDGNRLERVALEPGIAIVSERSFGAAPTGREEWLRGRIPALREGEPPDDSALISLMATHREPTFEGMCVHGSAQGYGTRTTTLVRMPARGAVEYHYTDGPPCTGKLVDVSDLAGSLGDVH